MRTKSPANTNAVIEHFIVDMFRERDIVISKAHQYCTQSDHPKYGVALKKPNAFNLDWVYSVACGGDEDGKACTEMIALDTKRFGVLNKTEVVRKYLTELGWTRLLGKNKHFTYPACGNQEHPV